MSAILRKARYLALPILLLLVSACASPITRPADTGSYNAALAGERKAGKLTVDLTPEARAMVGEDSTFDENELLIFLHRKLMANGALTLKLDSSLPEIEVLVTRVRARSTTAATWLSFLAGFDQIDAAVTVRSPNGTELQRFNVTASHDYVGGGADIAMYPLYLRFAKYVTKEVTGKETLE